MADPARRAEVAALLRVLGHEFVARELSDADLDALDDEVTGILARLGSRPERPRRTTREAVARFTQDDGLIEPIERRQLFADSIVSGGANPMGLGAELWREGDVAVMQVTLGRAFEGAPARSHGGVVAALLDETMGMAMGMSGTLSLTAELTITFRAPTPIGVPITSRAWLERRHGRKQHVRASLSAGDLVVAEATGLFIAVDPATVLDGDL